MKEYAPRAADVRLREPAEEDPQHRVGVGRGADRRARVRAHALLVDDDRRRQAVEHVHVRPRLRRHEALHERAVGLVDHPLRLGGDRAEHERALAGSGDAGEHRQPPLGDLEADVLEVVHARALHADQVVAVGDVQLGRLRLRRGHGAHARRGRVAVLLHSCSPHADVRLTPESRRGGMNLRGGGVLVAMNRRPSHLDTEPYDALIVGGGPAGLSAALVLGRARKRVLVVDEGRPANAVSQGVGGLLGHDRVKPARAATRRAAAARGARERRGAQRRRRGRRAGARRASW